MLAAVRTTVHAMTATQLTVDGPSRGGKDRRGGKPTIVLLKLMVLAQALLLRLKVF